jgi:hypothetical protein
MLDYAKLPRDDLYKRIQDQFIRMDQLDVMMEKELMRSIDLGLIVD